MFVSSESGVSIPSDMIHYGLTKTAQLALSRGLAKRLAGSGVTVNSVLPGPTLSEGVAAMLEGERTAVAAQFIEMTPRDHYSHFSAVIYEKLGTTLAPLASLLGAFAPQGADTQGAVKGLGNIKPMMIAAYGEPDKITIAGAGDLSSGMANLMSGNLLGALGNSMPLLQMHGTSRR